MCAVRQRSFPVALYCHQALVSGVYITRVMKGSLRLHFTLATLCWIIFLKPRTYNGVRRQRKRQQVYLVTSAITPPYSGPVCMQRSVPGKPCNRCLCPATLDLSGIVTTQQDKVWGFQTEQAVSRAWFSLSLHWPSPQLG